MEELALGRVDVLAAQRVVLAQLARLEADDPAARVGEREHQPLREVVVPARVRQPGGAQLVGREALLPRLRGERRPPARGRAGTRGRSPRRARGSRGTRAPAHRRPSPRGGARRTLPPGRARRAAARAACRASSSRGEVSSYSSVTRNRSASHSTRLGEVEVLRLAHERDHVAALAAAEAVVELVDRVDREARRPLLVERAAARVAGAGAAERRAAGDDLDHVGRGDRLPHRRVLDRGPLERLSVRRARSGRSCRRRSDADLVLGVAALDEVVEDPRDRRVRALVLRRAHARRGRRART